MKKFNSKKHLALSLVALILVLMMTVGVTYSWIDDLKQVEISTNDNGVNAPLKTGLDINSDVKITSENNTIDLGKMFTDSDTEYSGKLKYENNSNDSNKKPDWNTLNEKKGYFYESGDMHLSGCYSDGETFYFPKNNGGYREGNKDDENVNYISFTTKVESPDADVDFWFRALPVINKHDTNDSISQARYAINVDGESHVYSSDGTANTYNSSVTGVRRTAVYTYGNSLNTTEARGKNSNTLFSIKKGDTVYLNIKIWLEGGFDTNITASDINFQLVSSWGVPGRKIKVVDKTMGPAGESWINNDSAKLYLTLPSVLKSLNSTVSSWSSLENDYDYAPFFELTLDSGSTDTYTANNVPLVFKNEEMIVYRCTDKGWNIRTTNQSGADNAEQRSPYSVYCWNWWRTTLPNTYRDETYTLYGCSLDNSAHNAFSSVTATNEGYGTWGGVEEIKVYEYYYNTHYASYGGKMFLRDYSDYSTAQKVYTYEMYRANNNNNTPWKTYVPKSSALLQFDYFNSSTELLGQWGYNSWGNACPQQRPLKNNIYSSNSTSYNLAGNDNGNGRGFWNNANYVYLVKNGDMLPNNVTAYANMLDNDNNKFNGNVAMTVLRNADNTANVTYSSANNLVYKSDTVQASNSPSIYKDVNFNNNYKDQNDNWTIQSGNKILFAGCFYNFAEGTWMGSLSGTGRSAVTESDAGSSGTSSGGDTMTISTSMNGAGVYLYGALDGTGTHEQLAKMTNTSGNTYTGNLTLTASSNNTLYYIRVREATDSQHWTHYQDTNSYLVLESNMGTRDYTLRSTNSQPLYLRVEDTNTYKFTYDKSQHKITITLA